MLEVRGELSVYHWPKHGFVGSLFAYRETGRPRVNEDVVITPAGALDAARPAVWAWHARTPDARATAPGVEDPSPLLVRDRRRHDLFH